MRQKFSLILTLTAWLLATGSHWDLVQTFAWGRMIATYAEDMPFTQAVKKTFSPETTCPICRAVADAKEQQSHNAAVPTEKSPGKILLVCAPAALVFASPAPIRVGVPPSVLALSSADLSAPPSPPPRALA